MTDLQRFGLLDGLLFLLVLTAAAGARVWYVANYADGGEKPGTLAVQDPRPELWERDGQGGRAGSLVQHWRDDRRFEMRAPLAADEELTAHISPGYPWFLGSLARWFEDDRDLLGILLWTQCGLGACTAGFYFLFARRA